jgi:hypothetical protein
MQLSVDTHDNMIMEMDKDDNLVQRIRCLEHSKRPDLQMHDIWIGEHSRHNPYRDEIECTLMHGLLFTTEALQMYT